MKKLTKLLVTLLALSLVISVAAVVTSAADEPGYSVKSAKDFEDGIGFSVVNYNQNTSYSYSSFQVNTDSTGNKYGVFTVDLTEHNATEGTTENKTPGNPYISFPATHLIVHSVDESIERCGDYLVIDFDLSTEGEFIAGLNLNNVIRPGTKSNGKWSYSSFASNRTGSNIRGTNTEDGFYISSYGGSNQNHYPATLSDGGWYDVTMVVDLTDAANNGAVYFYINGYYAGMQTNFYGNTDNDTKNKRFEEIRFNVPDKSQMNNAVTSVALDNLSLRVYDIGYEGNIKGNLGTVNVQLDNIPELAYCLDNKPAPIDPSAPAFTVTRGEQTINVNSVAELEDILKSGDAVSVNRNVAETIFVEPSNVTFSSKNGYSYTVVTLDELNAASETPIDYVLRNRLGAILDYGTQVQTNVGDTDGYLDNDDLDALGAAIKAIGSTQDVLRVQLLDDINYGYRISVYNNLIFDLNGHRINLNGKLKSGSGEWHTFVAQKNSKLIFRNGKFLCNVSGVSVSNFNVPTAYMVFENLESYTHNNGNIDHRSGLILFKDIALMDINLNNAYFLRTFSRDKAGVITSVRMENCTGDFGNSYIYATNLSTGGKKFGGMKTEFVFKDCDFTANSSLVIAAFVADTAGLGNNNSFRVIANNTVIKAGATPFRIDAGAATAGMVNTITYELNGCKLGGTAMIDNRLDSAYGTPTMILSGTNLASFNTAPAGYVFANANTVYAKSALDSAYPYAITNRTTTYSWTLAGETVSEVWSADETPAEASYPVALPETTATYSYAWEKNGTAYTAVPTATFGAYANLTLYSDFTFNLLIPAELDTVAITVGSEAVQTEDTEVDGVSYKLVRVENIRPDNASDEFSVSVTVPAYSTDTATRVFKASVLKYAEVVLNSTDEKVVGARTLLAETVAYIAEAYAYRGYESDKLDAILASDAYKSACLADSERAYPEAVDTMTALEGKIASARLNLGSSFKLVFTADEDYEGEVTFSYRRNGVSVTETVALEGGESYELDIRAFDIDKTVSVSADGVSGSYNVSAYLAFAKESGEAGLVSLVEAVLDYAQAAKEYKATLA